MDSFVQYIKRLYLRAKYYRYGWKGDYASWAAASAKCGGYDAANIVEKVKAAALKVKEGSAVFEKDGRLYPEITWSWPLLSQLLWIAGQRGQQLSVLDWGGSLGSSYFQNRGYLQHLERLQWSIVEQAGFVKAGNRGIAGGPLAFFDSIEEAMAARGPHDILLLSCVLPYLEKPYDFLLAVAEKAIPYIIIENTYFNPAPENRLTIQKVPPVYYDAAYPAWFLDYQQVVDTLLPRYEMLAAYKNEEILYLDGQLVNYKGCIMRRKICN